MEIDSAPVFLSSHNASGGWPSVAYMLAHVQLRKVDVPGDNHCGYWALLLSLAWVASDAFCRCPWPKTADGPEAEGLMARMRSLRRLVAGWMRANKGSRLLRDMPSLWLAGGELKEATLRRHGEGEAWVAPEQWRALAGLLGTDIAVLHQPADLVPVYSLTRPLRGGPITQSWRETLAPRLTRQHAGTCEWHGRKLVVIHWNGSNHFSATRPI